MDPFATLGLPARYDLDPREVERKYRELQRTLHPDANAQKDDAERRATLEQAVAVNEAYRVLSDDVRRAEALLATKGITTAENGGVDQMFLMEVMELREALVDAKVSKNLAQVTELEALVTERKADAVSDLILAFSGNDPDEVGATDALGRLRYYARFLEEVAAYYDEHDAAGEA